MVRGSIALLRVQHSAYKNPRSSCSASVFAVYQRYVPSRLTFTRSPFLSLSRWCDSVDAGMPSSSEISPGTMPPGCAESRRRIMRSRGPAPMAANMSAKRVISSSPGFAGMIRYYYSIGIMEIVAASARLLRTSLPPISSRQKEPDVRTACSGKICSDAARALPKAIDRYASSYGTRIAGRLEVRATAPPERAFRCLQPANRRPKWERRQEGEWRFRRKRECRGYGMRCGVFAVSLASRRLRWRESAVKNSPRRRRQFSPVIRGHSSSAANLTR